MDETYIWEHSARQYSWHAPGEHRSPLRVRSSKGKRWAVIHAGSTDGWVMGADFFDVGAKDGDFHGTITAEFFEEWVVKTLIPRLPKKREAKVAYPEDALKPELLLLLDQHVPIRPKLEAVVNDLGHDILWLPPYHPEYNRAICKTVP